MCCTPRHSLAISCHMAAAQMEARVRARVRVTGKAGVGLTDTILSTPLHHARPIDVRV